MKKILFATTSLLIILTILFPLSISAQEETSTPPKEVKYKAKIVELEKGQCPQDRGEGECYFFTLEILDGEKKGETVESIASETDDPKLELLNYKKGLKVYIVETEVAGETGYYVKEPLRKTPVLTLTLMFILFVTAIGGIQGLSSLLGLAISFIVLFVLVIPLMLSGTNPIMAAIIGSSIILTSSIYLSHGFNRKTSIALIGTLISLGVTAVLAYLYTMATRLTGYSTEEATFLVQLIDKTLDMRGILLASIIIGGIGILDDITVSQVSTIIELFKANPSFTWEELFKRSMRVGRDHIASMVNTLVLAYTGSALPLVMLFMASGASFEEIINFELVTEEIVRTLIGSIGLILAVPITSLIACIIIVGKDKQANLRVFKR
jgi:uncharacterized membrane protein